MPGKSPRPLVQVAQCPHGRRRARTHAVGNIHGFDGTTRRKKASFAILEDKSLPIQKQGQGERLGSF